MLSRLCGRDFWPRSDVILCLEPCNGCAFIVIFSYACFVQLNTPVIFNIFDCGDDIDPSAGMLRRSCTSVLSSFKLKAKTPSPPSTS